MARSNAKASPDRTDVQDPDPAWPERRSARCGFAMKPIWIVDDDQSIRFVLEKALAREEFAVRSFTNTRDVLAALDDDEPQVLVSDIRMPGGSGIELLTKVKAHAPRPAGHHHDRLLRPRQRRQRVPGRRLRVPAQALRRAQGGRADPPRGRGEPARGGAATRRAAQVPEMLGQAPAMQDVFRAIGRLSQSIVTVLITGESGSGKELVAHALHKHSPRAERPVRRDQHRGDPEGPARVRAVRPRARRLHRRADDAARPLRAGRRRHAVPRRDRRHAVRPADAAAARAVRRPVLPRRRPQPDAQQRARRSPRRTRTWRTRVKAGAFREDLFHRLNVIRLRLPALRERRRGHAAAGALLPAEERARARRRGQAHHRRGARAADRSSTFRATCASSRTSATG